MSEGNNNQNTDGQASGNNNQQQSAGKTFTQAELDAIINDRLTRERSKYADYEDLKKAKGELEQLKAGQMTEAEKLKQSADEAAQKAQAAEVRLKETVTRLEVERQARKLSIVDEDAAYRLLDTSAITFDEDGKPTNIEALLTDLVKAKPYLVAQQTTPQIGATNPARGSGNAKDAFTAALYRGAGLQQQKG